MVYLNSLLHFAAGFMRKILLIKGLRRWCL
jgi:hypothetical protein